MTSFVGALIGIMSKVALDYYDPFTLSFASAFTPTFVILLMRTENKTSRVNKTVKKFYPYLLAITLMIIATDVLYMYALSLERVSIIIPLRSLSIMFIAAGGYLFLKERDNLPKKIIGFVLAFAGSLFV